MAILDWPTILRPADLALSLSGASVSGGRSPTGREQVVTAPSWRWKLRYSGLHIRTPEQIRTIRALEAQLDGRAGLLRLPIFDCFRTNGYVGNPADANWRYKPHGDGSPFGDQSYYRQPGTGGGIVSLTANAALNATSLQVAWTDLPPTPGLHFSMADSLYRVATMTVTGPNAGTITIRPWLRNAFNIGDQLNFLNPRAVMRLSADDGLSLDLKLWRRDSLTVEFEEP